MKASNTFGKSVLHFRSLAIRMTLMITGMTIVVLAVIVLTFTIYTRQKLTQDIFRNGKTFATFTALSIYENYAQFYTHPEASDFANFKSNVGGILSQDSDIVQTQMISLNGRVLFSSDELKTGKYSSPVVRNVTDTQTVDAAAKNTASNWDVTRNGKRLTMIVVPVYETGGGHFLSMTYLLSYNSLDMQFTSALRPLAWVFLGLIVLVTILTFLFSTSLARPITRLTKVAERLRSGDLDAHATITSDDEIGRLALTLNNMARQIKLNFADLKTSRARIVEQNRTLESDKAQLKASINSIDVGFIMTDHNDKVVLINGVAEHLLAYATRAGVGKQGSVRHDWTTDRVNEKFQPGFPFKASLLKAREQHEIIQQDEVSFNGRILRIFIAPILDAEPEDKQSVLGTVTVLNDVTEQKVMERSKDEFFSIASHELRTPLTSIKGNTSMILEYYQEILKDPQLKEMVTDVHDSSVRLIEIVNDFLDASRLEQGKMTFTYEAVGIEEIIESVAYEMGAVLNEKHISLTLDKVTLDVSPKVWADKNRLKQVFFNLVGNAAKFTEKGSIAVSAVVEDTVVKVLVVDTGRGMTLESQQLLFHKFQQASSSLLTRDTSRGTGLGLYISKMIVEGMGGTIALERSEVDKGSTFSFTVPIATAERQASAKTVMAVTASTDTATGLTSVNPQLSASGVPASAN